MTKAEAGSLGGKATYAKHGSEYMSTIGRKGAEALWKNYTLVPVGTSQFILVKKESLQ